MNPKQKIAAGIVCVILVEIFLYPPFAQFPGVGMKVGVGWGFINEPPDGDYSGNPVIDTSTLFIEYVIVVTIGVIALYALKDRKK